MLQNKIASSRPATGSALRRGVVDGEYEIGCGGRNSATSRPRFESVGQVNLPGRDPENAGPACTTACCGRRHGRNDPNAGSGRSFASSGTAVAIANTQDRRRDTARDVPGQRAHARRAQAVHRCPLGWRRCPGRTERGVKIRAVSDQVGGVGQLAPALRRHQSRSPGQTDGRPRACSGRRTSRAWGPAKSTAHLRDSRRRREELADCPCWHARQNRVARPDPRRQRFSDLQYRERPSLSTTAASRVAEVTGQFLDRQGAGRYRQHLVPGHQRLSPTRSRWAFTDVTPGTTDARRIARSAGWCMCI